MKPHLVMVVPNRVEGDSRVERVAKTGVDAGYRVSVLGIDGSGERTMVLGGAPTARIRLSPRVAWLHPRRKKLESELRTVHLEGIEARLRRLVRDRKDLAFQPSARRRLLTAAYLLEGLWLSSRRRQMRSDAEEPAADRVRTLARRARIRVLPDGGWRQTVPAIADQEESFVPWLVALEPDLIHVHDAPLLPAVSTASSILGKRGRRPKIVYDVHEWWPGVRAVDVDRVLATRRLERTYACIADEVVTVGPVIAEWLAERFGLAEPPTVVENCPSRESGPAAARATVRDEAGVPQGTPLLVYSGAIAEARGVSDAVRAIAHLTTAHLAIVCSDLNPDFAGSLRALADELGVADRVHFLPYVPAQSVGWYLESADIGLAPFRRSASHDSAIATKVSEYVRAGLPIVGSDCAAMAEYLRTTGVGEVFRAGQVTDLVRAVEKVLDEHESYRAALTEPVRESRTWEAQEPALLDVYRRLVGPPAEPAPQDRIIVIGYRGRSDVAADGLSARIGGTFVPLEPRPAHDRPALEDHTASARAFRAFGSLADARAVIYAGLGPPGFGPITRSPIDELLLLRQLGVPCFLVDPENYATEQALTDLAGAGCVLTSSRPGAHLSGVGELPYIPYAPRPAMHRVAGPVSAPLRVVVHTAWQGAQDVIEIVRDLQAEGVEVGLASARNVSHALLTGTDVFVTDLTRGHLTPTMIDAMSAGTTVVGHLDQDWRSSFSDAPVVECTPGTAREVLAGLFSDVPRVARIADDSMAYVEKRHTAEARDDALGELVSRVLARGSTT